MSAERPDFSHEIRAAGRGYRLIAGVDEVGRGPLAGPVMAAAVILDPDAIPEGLNDSKKLSRKKREALRDALLRCAEIGIGTASVAEIAQLNILRASQLAMRRALLDLPRRADFALIDGHLMPPDLPCPAETLKGGDGRSLSIAAASIMAKVGRDEVMVGLAQQHPGYGWERNAGYPTVEHKEGLKRHGVSPHHRRTFAPIHNILLQEKN